MSKYSRKDFLKLSGLASASLLLPNFLKGMGAGTDLRMSEMLLPVTNGKRLVVIQLSGGNDGLNTVVPRGDDLYYSNRSGLGLKGAELINLDTYFSLNAKLQGLADLYMNGEVAIINSVGYPNPNRSHFRSLDIWQSASDADKYVQSGWIGRWLDSACSNGDYKPYYAMELDDAMSLALKGNILSGIAVSNPKRMNAMVEDPLIYKTAKAWTAHMDDEHHIEYLHKTLAQTEMSVQAIYDKSGRKLSKEIYPVHAFGKHLKMIAELIMADAETSVFYISLAGFDTHAGQKNQQGRLLNVYGNALRAFAQDLKSVNRWNDTLVMTFSEFGRRVKQNASAGTDHGAANVMLLAGGGLKRKGILNEAPDLKNLVDGDLQFKVDFRRIYASVLKNWLGADANGILGGTFETMDFV
jgi:uncharacterized protein (DUF1501 family)